MEVIVLGDSHSRIFSYMNNKQKEYKFKIQMVNGASAYGSINQNSKTRAFNEYTDYLEENKIKNKKNKKIIIMLGEVDCGYLIYVRSQRHSITIDEQINCCIDNLSKFIKNELVDKFKFHPSDIIICGSILPTIKDNTDKNFLNGSRKEVKESQQIRTEKTLLYNSLLKSEAEKNNYNYIDITEHIINKKTNIVKDFYLNSNKYDHHLNNKRTYKLWFNELNKII